MDNIRKSQYGKTSPELCHPQEDVTLRLCCKRSQKPRFQCLILGDGPTPEWYEAEELISLGACTTPNISEQHSDAGACSLSLILEENAPDKYFLSPKACEGTDLFVDESVDTAEQAIQNLLLEDLHQALLKLSPAERDFILSYYEMKIPNATCLAQRYGITRQAADKRLKKIEEKIKKLVAIF